jgi:hypothetical protein
LVAGLIAAGFGLGVAGCGGEEREPRATGGGEAMGSMSAGAGGTLPPVGGFYDGQQVMFVHPEASDRKVAKVLSEMMDSPVLVVPELAEAPDGALADIYAFQNGVRGDGPFGFQPDVFDSAPGEDGYSPLRALHFVSWKQSAKPRVLRSVAKITRAERAGELSVKRSEVVVNMPFVQWPGGSR